MGMVTYVSNEKPYLSVISSKFVVLLLHRLAKHYFKHPSGLLYTNMPYSFYLTVKALARPLRVPTLIFIIFIHHLIFYGC